MTTANSTANLVLGRGELYFDRFPTGSLEGEGELYLGNTPGFTLERSTQATKRSRSVGGQIIEQAGIVTKDEQAGDFETDNVDMENLALWYGGTVDDTGQGAQTNLVESFQVKRGRWRQLGVSVHRAGLSNVTAATFRKSGVIVAAVGNITLDLALGRFKFDEDAADLADGDTVDVTFTCGVDADPKLSSAPREVTGSLRYVSTNPVGPKVDYFFPYVSLTPRRDIDWKRDDFVTIGFSMVARKLDAETEIVYIRQRAAQ